MERIKCIVCGGYIESLYFESVEPEDPSQGAWLGGIVETITMPHGSVLENNKYVIGICDKCIVEKHNSGIIGKHKRI